MAELSSEAKKPLRQSIRLQNRKKIKLEEDFGRSQTQNIPTITENVSKETEHIDQIGNPTNPEIFNQSPAIILPEATFITATKTKYRRIRKQTNPKKKDPDVTTIPVVLKVGFVRFVRDIFLKYKHRGISQIQSLALEALKEASDLYLTFFLEDAYRHAWSVRGGSIKLWDVKLARIIRDGVKEIVPTLDET